MLTNDSSLPIFVRFLDIKQRSPLITPNVVAPKALGTISFCAKHFLQQLCRLF